MKINKDVELASAVYWVNNQTVSKNYYHVRVSDDNCLSRTGDTVELPARREERETYLARLNSLSSTFAASIAEVANVLNQARRETNIDLTPYEEDEPAQPALIRRMFGG